MLVFKAINSCVATESYGRGAALLVYTPAVNYDEIPKPTSREQAIDERRRQLAKIKVFFGTE